MFKNAGKLDSPNRKSNHQMHSCKVLRLRDRHTMSIVTVPERKIVATCSSQPAPSCSVTSTVSRDRLGPDMLVTCATSVFGISALNQELFQKLNTSAMLSPTDYKLNSKSAHQSAGVTDAVSAPSTGAVGVKPVTKASKT